MKNRHSILLIPVLVLCGCYHRINPKKAKEIISELQKYRFDFAKIKTFSMETKNHFFASGLYEGNNQSETEDTEAMIEYNIDEYYIHVKYVESDEEYSNTTEIERETEEEWVFIKNGTMYYASSEIEQEPGSIDEDKAYKIINNLQTAKTYFTNYLTYLSDSLISVLSNDYYLSTAKSIINDEVKPGIKLPEKDLFQ